MKKLFLTILGIIIIVSLGLTYITSFAINNPVKIEGWNYLRGRNFSFSYPNYLVVEELTYDNPRESYSVHNNKLSDTMDGSLNNDLIYGKIILSKEKDTGFLEDFSYQYWDLQTYPSGGPADSTSGWSKPEKIADTDYLIVKRTKYIFYPLQSNGEEPLMSEDFHYFIKLDEADYIHMIFGLNASYDGVPYRDQVKQDIENIAKSIQPF